MVFGYPIRQQNRIIEASSSGKTRAFDSRIRRFNSGSLSQPALQASPSFGLVFIRIKNPSTARARGGCIGISGQSKKEQRNGRMRYMKRLSCSQYICGRNFYNDYCAVPAPIKANGCDRCTGAGMKSSVVFQIPDSIQRMPVGKAGDGKVDVMSEAHGQKERFRRTNQIGVQAGV